MSLPLPKISYENAGATPINVVTSKKGVYDIKVLELVCILLMRIQRRRLDTSMSYLVFSLHSLGEETGPQDINPLKD